MASVASRLIEEFTAHAQSDSLEDAQEICADGTYFPNNLRILPAENRRLLNPFPFKTELERRMFRKPTNSVR